MAKYKSSINLAVMLTVKYLLLFYHKISVKPNVSVVDDLCVQKTNIGSISYDKYTFEYSIKTVCVHFKGLIQLGSMQSSIIHDWVN